MNEELKIIIKAVTADAQRNLAGVREELGRIEQTGEGTGKSVSSAMATMGKAAGVTIGIVMALTSAMVALGKKSMEFRKEYAKLTASFLASNGTVEQATKTYKELFGFLGESDTTVEAAQNLAQITTNSEDLAQWTQILQGVYARFGKSLPVESLAEAANETIKVGKVTGAMADALNWAGVSEDAFNAALANTTSLEEREMLIRSTLNQLYGDAAKIYERNNQATIAYQKSQADLDMALSEATVYIVPLLTQLNNLAALLLQVLKPAFETVSAMVIVFVQWIAAAVQSIGSFFGVFDSAGSDPTGDVVDSLEQVEASTNNAVQGVTGLGGALTDAAQEAAKLKKQVMGFDELNVVSPPTIAAGATGGGAAGGGLVGGLNIPTMDSLGFNIDSLRGFTDKIEDVKERMEGIAMLATIVGVSLGAWRILDFINDIVTANKLVKIAGEEGARAFQKAAGVKAQEYLDGIKTKLMTIGGQFAIIVGLIATAYGYSDAWADGVDWGNLAVTMGGLAAVVTGLGLAYGGLAASIGAVIAGVALMILGVKDFIENGATLQNTILIIGGAIAVAVGLATAGLSVLVSAIIAATTAVAAFTAAILLEKPAIKSVQEAQEALTKAKQDAANAENDYINAIDNAEAALKRLEEVEKANGITGAELYAQVQAGTLDYTNMTAAQREVYKAYLDNEKKQKALKESTEAFNQAKKAETLASYENQLALAKESGNYDKFKASIVKAFEAGELSADEARELISKSMSEMSDDAQQTFMKDIPGSLRDGLDPHKYESTGTKIVKAFKRWGDQIVADWNKLTTKFKEVGAKIGEAISSKVSAAFTTVLSWIIDRVNGFIKAINKAVDVINKIPGANIKPMTLLTVPKMATGGIVNSATIAMIGERGREAVLPLENNTGWMDALADRIAARNGTPTRVVLKVGETELGYATIGAINNITQQTGELPLVVV